MKHIITLNNRYLSNWKERIKPNGGIFIYDLEFTTNKDDAREIPFYHVPTIIIAVRNLVTPFDSTEKDGTVTYNVVTHTTPTLLTNDVPITKVPYKPQPSLDATSTFGKKLNSTDNNINNTNVPNDNAKVEVSLDWLNHFMITNKLKPIDIAIAFGYEGKRVYYGTKIIKGLIRLRYHNIVTFAEKYPDIHGHWYFTRQGN